MRKRTASLIMLTAIAISLIASGCSRDEVPSPSADIPEKTAAVLVYYSTGRTLVEERRVVADSPNLPKVALEEMLKASPKSNTEIAIVQPEAKILDVIVDKKGLATVNFSREVLNFKATDREKRLAFAAILKTLKQFDKIKTVKFQVEGKESGLVNGSEVKDFWGAVSLATQPWTIDKVIAGKK